jgi:type IV secretory pathway VirB2 component (pilin)/type IV secretory pathway TrbD component
MRTIWRNVIRLKAASRQACVIVAGLFLATPAFAQGTSPWENAVSVLQQAFTSTIARGLSLVAIVVAGLTFAFGEGGSKRVLAGVLFGVGMAIAAVNFLSWLFPGNWSTHSKEKHVAEARRINRVHRALSRPLTILGAERKLFFFAMCLGAATFNLLNSLFGGLLMFLLLYFMARWATQTDPQILRFLLTAARIRAQYDPMKFSPIAIRRDGHAQA